MTKHYIWIGAGVGFLWYNTSPASVFMGDVGSLPLGAGLGSSSGESAGVDAALERTTHRVTYDGGYRRIDYPGGDVPDDIGVCTDVVIRSFRGVGIDLQKRVHEDRRAHFRAYPALWGLARQPEAVEYLRLAPARDVMDTKLGLCRDLGSRHIADITVP